MALLASSVAFGVLHGSHWFTGIIAEILYVTLRRAGFRYLGQTSTSGSDPRTQDCVHQTIQNSAPWREPRGTRPRALS
jgi:hypothetical protein